MEAFTSSKILHFDDPYKDKFQRRGSTQKGLKRMTRFHIDPLNLEKANKPSGEKVLHLLSSHSSLIPHIFSSFSPQ
jgi:hypothetical protein